jgi:hypothetical protein
MNSAAYKTVLVVKVLGQVLFLFGLLAWLDGVGVQFIEPMYLAAPVSHLFLWLRTDTFTILSFIASGVGFFMWRLSGELIKSEQNKIAH